MERTDDLGINGLHLVQDTDLFCFGTDSVQLSDFARARPGDTVVDLCTGNGIIPVLMSAKTRAKKFYGIELQKRSFDLACKNAALNGLQDRVEFICGDIKDCRTLLPNACADAVTCNPPYMPAKSGFVSPTDEKAIARHEIAISIEGIAAAAAWLLKFGGHLYMVHRADRLCDVICTMRKYNIEPKRLAFMHPSPHRAPNLILVDGMVGANPALKIEEPIYISERE